MTGTAPQPSSVFPARRRFADLRSAGRELAEALAAHGAWDDALVLGIARGGVPAAVEVARTLGRPLDVLLLKRLFTRDDDTFTCGVRVAGTLVLDRELDARTASAGPGASAATADALAELDARDALCRGDRPPVSIAGRTVLLVDNGIHTGATARIAIRAVRALGAGRVAIATPAANAEVLPTIGAEADDVIALAAEEPFGHTGLWYRILDVPGFDRIATLLREPESAPAGE